MCVQVIGNDGPFTIRVRVDDSIQCFNEIGLRSSRVKVGISHPAGDNIEKTDQGCRSMPDVLELDCRQK